MRWTPTHLGTLSGALRRRWTPAHLGTLSGVSLTEELKCVVKSGACVVESPSRWTQLFLLITTRCASGTVCTVCSVYFDVPRILSFNGKIYRNHRMTYIWREMCSFGFRCRRVAAPMIRNASAYGS